MRTVVHRLLIIVAAVASLLLSGCGNNREQLLQLEELEQQNRADSVMRDLELAQSLADYFDRHGSHNEQLRAHYILGRTHADLGELPQAVIAYNNAADRADTTSLDCDYRTLCRVYSQLAAIFFRQNLLDDNLRCIDQSIFYANKANDTIAAITLYGQKLGAYDKRNLTDSIISVSTQTYRRFAELGYPEMGSRFLSLAVNGYIQKGNLDMARHYMNIYEAESGYFDSIGNIEQGREVYYNIKGKFYLAYGRLDSAEYSFRKELRDGHNFNDQNMASFRLAKLYHRIGNPDSAAKYVFYAYDMNDSTYSQATTEAVAQMQASYDYSSHQQIAQREKERADKEKQKTEILFTVIVGIVVVGTFVAYRLKKHQIAERAAYMTKVNELEQVQNDVFYLRSHEIELDSLLHEKEKILERLNNEIAKYHLPICKAAKDTVEEQLKASAVYQMLLSKADKGEVLTNAEWHELNKLVIAILPELHQLLSSKTYKLSIPQHRTAKIA